MLPQLYTIPKAGIINIAHRGASAYFPENTMPAFKAAIDMHADMIELDVQLTRDGVPVVYHDPKLHTHTNGKGRIEDFSLNALKKLDAGSWFDKKFAGTFIPTLQEVLAWAQDKIAVNIEIKTEAVTDSGEEVEQKCLQLVQRYEMGSHVIFSSFDMRAVKHIKKLCPDMPVGLLFSRRIQTTATEAKLVEKYHANTFNCSYRQLTKQRVANLQTHNIPILVYTVDEPAKMQAAIEKGVTGMFTNKPDVLREICLKKED